MISVALADGSRHLLPMTLGDYQEKVACGRRLLRTNGPGEVYILTDHVVSVAVQT